MVMTHDTWGHIFKSYRMKTRIEKNAQLPAGQSVWFMVCLYTWKLLVCAHQKGYVNVSTCQKMFCLERWQLCPWCRCTFDFLAGPEVKSSKIKYVTNLGVQGNMNVITPLTSTPTSPHAWSGCSAGVCKGTWTPTPPHPPQPQPPLAWRVRMYACGVRQWVILGVRRCVLLACADGSFALEARVEWTRMHMWCHW